MKLLLEFGALAPPLREQLESQRVMVGDPMLLKKYQELADNVTRLWMADLITENEMKLVNNRLNSQIISNLFDIRG